MKKKVLAVASSGGHWTQLSRLFSVLDSYDVHCVSTNSDFVVERSEFNYSYVNDANFSEKYKLLFLALRMLWLVLKLRPDVVITTGAAPGFFAIFWGKICRAKTIWIDSIANSDELSKAGKYAGRYADLWLTQWPNLSKSNGPRYEGSVI